MTNKLYKFEIDAPATAEKCKSLLMSLDKNQGPMFRIEKAWIQCPELDAIAAADTVAFQISLQSQNENSDILEISSEYEVFTHVWDFHLAEAAITSTIDMNRCVEIPDIVGTMLECNKKNYLTCMQTGAGAADQTTNIKILGQYVSTNIDDWNYNQL
jgi:hypothetical protein